MIHFFENYDENFIIFGAFTPTTKSDNGFD